MGTPLVIRNTQSPGDIVVLTAAIRDMALRHPGKFDVNLTVSPGAEHIFWNNPYIKSASPIRKTGAPKGQQFVAHYPLIHQSNQAKKHFLWGFVEYMNLKLKTDIKLMEFRPNLHMSDQEAMTPLIEPPYWVFLSGGKTDFRTKIWARKYWEQVIGATRKDIRWVQCGGGSKNHIMHEKVPGVFSYMVKKTSSRDFIRLIYHADGVVCAVTAAMHIAAAFNKPCIVIAGGREPWWWEAYNNENRLFNMRVGDPSWTFPENDTYVEHKYLHTQDQLKCCMNKGCWKSKLTGKNAKCQNIVTVGKQQLPKCLQMITPELVVNSIFEYYNDKIIDRDGMRVPAMQPTEAPHKYYLYGGDPTWADALKKKFPDAVMVNGASRLEAIKKAAAETEGHIFWFEEGSRPKSDYWLRMLLNVMSPSTVCGRMYRTKAGGYYPHPGFFAAPAKRLNKDAKTYPELFTNIARDQFLPVSSDIHIPVVRPCINQDEQ